MPANPVIFVTDSPDISLSK